MGLTSRQRAFRAIVQRLRLHHLLSRSYAGLGTVLAFHRVVPDAREDRVVNRDIEVTADELDALIAFLLDGGYELVSLDTACERLLAGRARPAGRFACLTFDDGYLDTYEVAYPILRKHRAPVTLYVATDFPDRRAVLWWYLLEDLLDRSEVVSFVWGDARHEHRLLSADAKTVAFRAIAGVICACGSADRAALFDRLFVAHGLDPHAYSTLALTWAHLDALTRDPDVTIGAHTVGHYALGSLEADEVRREMRESRRLLEERTGRRVTHFAFPYGAGVTTGAREVALSAEVGFRTAATTRQGNLFPAHARHLHCLPRISVGRDTAQLTEIDLLISGFLPAVRNGFKRVVTT